MRTLAIKPSTHDFAKQNRRGEEGRHLVSHSSRSILPLSTGQPLLQRQCACGGGCPRCRDDLGLQTKLKISEPGDQYEQEADRVADEVMQISEPLQRQVEGEEKEQVEGMMQQMAIADPITPSVQKQPIPDIEQQEDESLIQTNLSTDQILSVEYKKEFLPLVQEILQSPGQLLEPSTRSLMELHFGSDFSRVRVHTNAIAATAANTLNAKAFTIGNEIVFGTNQHSLGSSDGKRLLAHELTHVVQQAPDRLLRKKDKTVLEKQEITSARIVDDLDDVQKIIQDTLSNSDSKIFPYVKDKLKDLKDGKTKYDILDASEFAYEYRKYAKKRGISIDSSIKDEKLVENIGGFYDPARKSIYLKTRSDYCSAFHETIHSFSSPDFLSAWLGHDLMEGLTQFFTDVVFKEQLGKVCQTHKYENQLKCATKLVNTVGFESLARLFFLKEIAQLDVIVKKLNLTNKETLNQLKSEGVCKKIM